jgi:lipoprotein-releasing system permease protein
MLKSMGFTAADVTVIFFFEGLAIGALGVLIGSFGGYALTEFLASLPIPQKGLIESEHLVMANEPRLYFIAAAFSFGATLFAATLPALRAGRLDPVVTLRGRG